MAIFLGLTSILVGAGIYYTQISSSDGDMISRDTSVLALAAPGLEGTRDLPVTDHHMVEMDGAPLGYRACFTVSNSLAMMTETYAMIDDAVPGDAPGWFDCFDADRIGLALDEGRALAFLGQKDVRHGIDRVIAVLPDGRGFAWDQKNEEYEN